MPTASSNVRVRGQSGKHMLALSSSQFGPKADVHVSFLNSRLGGAKFAYIGHLRLVRFRIPDRDAAEGEVEMFISQKDGRMSRILTIGAAQLGPTQRSGDRASVVQRMLDLMRQARQRVILRD
ncbi:MAG TPA: hypothetical protein VNN81_01985 [Bradyrhizobium sp.]|nr:hypothetical protein [Bradyrhizobium sp.]